MSPAGRERPVHRCGACGHETPKWHGRCPGCDAWDTMERVATPRGAVVNRRAADVVALRDLRGETAGRIGTGIGELDRVLGGGLVPGAAVLLAGEPGIGKSTLLLQCAASAAGSGRGPALYVSAEESAEQLRRRAERLGLADAELLVSTEPAVEAIVAACQEHRPPLLLVDSIQTVRAADASGIPGSIGQVRESAARLVGLAKVSGTPVILVGHVTKEGAVAGPRVLEHVVDTVLQFEGDRFHEHRLLRALKNRFGATEELGVFAMTERGLAEVAQPSELFLAERRPGAPGSAVLASIEGTRPLLVEVQALVGEPVQGTPRRTAIGWDGPRLAMLLALLGRHLGLDVAARDIFVNVTGGVHLRDPGADLAVAAAVVSGATGRALDDRLVLFGELGLTGEVRGVARSEQRLREAARLGFRHALVPRLPDDAAAVSGLTAEPVESLARLSVAIARGVGTAVSGGS